MAKSTHLSKMSVPVDIKQCKMYCCVNDKTQEN